MPRRKSIKKVKINSKTGRTSSIKRTPPKQGKKILQSTLIIKKINVTKPQGILARLKSSIKSFFGKSRSKKALVFLVISIGFFVWLFWGVPLPTNLASETLPVSTKIYDRNGKLIYEIFADQRRTPITLTELPQDLKDATIAIEDKDFYKHYGYSLTGITRAAYSTVFKQKLQGGSTITQQLVKNALLSPERTIKRKLQEFALSMIVETIYSKDQILEMYLNQIPYGSTTYGIEAASEHYFGKPAKELNLSESALLAGLTQAPTKYSPFGVHPERAKERQLTVIRRMVEDGYITEEEAESAKNTELKFSEIEDSEATHFALWVKELLAEKYGDKVVEQGGLRVYTTLDIELQQYAQGEVAKEIEKLSKLDVGNGAALVTRPGSGEILAMVGSKDYFANDEDGKVNIIFAKRQPGSSIKPLNYALAIKDKRITPSTPLIDVPTCFVTAGLPSYCPKNYDGGFHGAVQTRFALGNSYNIPAVRVLALNGTENFIDFATSMGITTFNDPKNYGLSLTLGGGEVMPYDMAVAFGVFANSGVKQPLYPILKVEDWRGKVLEENKTEELDGERVLEPGVAYLISHILLDNNARSGAFGSSSFLVVSGHPEVSVKTGTTNDRRDNWTIGYTPQILVVTWVGNNDNSPMGGAVSGVSGASPIWNRIIKNALDRAEKGAFNSQDKGHAWPNQPDDVVGANICIDTGNAPGTPEDPNATTGGCATRFEYFLKDAIGARVDAGRKDFPIDKTTGLLAKEDTPPENIEMQNKFVIIDPLGSSYCFDCQATQSATIRYPIIFSKKTN
jgi:penicillin-binding protein 1C